METALVEQFFSLEIKKKEFLGHQPNFVGHFFVCYRKKY